MCLHAPCVTVLVFVCTIGALACKLVQLDRERGGAGVVPTAEAALRLPAARRRRRDRPALAAVPIPVCRSLLILSGRFSSAGAVDQLTSSDVRRQAGLVVLLNTARGESSSAYMMRFAVAAPPSARLLLARGRDDVVRIPAFGRPPSHDEIYAATRVELERSMHIGAFLKAPIALLTDDEVDAVVDTLSLFGSEGVALLFTDVAAPYAQHVAAVETSRARDEGNPPRALTMF